MAGRLAGVDLVAVLGSAKASLVRIEQQPIYRAAADLYRLDRWLAGDPIDPLTVGSFAGWIETAQALTSRGVSMKRVRVEECPPTDYQRYARWLGRWNISAGEELHYLSRPSAPTILTAGTSDYWIVDESTAVELGFDGGGELLMVQIVEDRDEVSGLVADWRALLSCSAIDDQGEPSNADGAEGLAHQTRRSC